ncbi:MAG: hypothetical protein ACFFCT_12940 [Candidatus Odinarchaeota archaeon]
MAIIHEDRFSVTCANCGARYTYRSENINANGQVQCQNCGKWVTAVGVPLAGERPPVGELESYIPWNKREPKVENEIPRLLAHGFIYSILSLAISFIFMMMLVIFAIFGGFIGIIIALLVLAEMIGGVNIALADAVWQIKCRSGQVSLLGHGGLLFLFLLITGILGLPLAFSLAMMGYSLYIISQLLYLFIFSLIDGFVCRFVALQFEIGTDDGRSLAEGYISATCPHCNSRYAYNSSSIDEKGTVACQNCTYRFILPVGVELG